MQKVGVTVKNSTVLIGNSYRSATVYVSDAARRCKICGTISKGDRFLCLHATKENINICEPCVDATLRTFKILEGIQAEGKHVFPSLP